MQRKKSSIYLVLIFCVGFTLNLAGVSVVLGAQQSFRPSGDLPNVLKKEQQNKSNQLNEIEKLISVLEKVGKLDESQKLELARLSKIREFLQRNLEAIQKTTLYDQQIKAAPAQLKSIEKEMAEPIPVNTPRSNSSATLDELEKELDITRSQLDSKRKFRDDVETESNRRSERQKIIGEEIDQDRKRLDELKVLSVVSSDSNKTLTGVENQLVVVELAFIEQKLQQLELEIQSYDVTRDLLRARRQLAERQVLIAEQLYSIQEQKVSQLRTQQAVETVHEAEEAIQAAIFAHPLIQVVAEENRNIATEISEISTTNTTLSSKKQQLEESLAHYKRSFESIKEKITQVGLTDAIGLKLRSDRKLLPEKRILLKRLEKRRIELNQVQLRRIEIEDRLLELVDLKREAMHRLAETRAILSPAQADALLKALNQALLEQRENYLRELVKVYDIYFEKKLYPIFEAERSQEILIAEYRDFIDERVLWIQSTSPINPQDLRVLVESVVWILYPLSWVDLIAGVSTEIVQKPLAFLFSLLLILSLIASKGRLKARLAISGKYVTKLSKARFSDSLLSGIITVLLSLPIPLLCWLFAWRLAILPIESAFSSSVSAALMIVGNMLIGLLVLRGMCGKEGLAEAHFRWRPESLKLIRRNLTWFIPLFVPLVFILNMTLNQSVQSYLDTIGRVAFIVAMLSLNVLMYKLFHPARGLPQQIIAKSPGGWLDRLKIIWFSIFLLVPFALAAAAGLGYLYTAIQLELKIEATVWMVLLIVFAHGFLIRWLNITQRKLTIDQWRKRIAQAAVDDGTEAVESEIPIPDEFEIDVAALSAQTIKLINSGFWFAVILGVVIIWADVLPALNMLKAVVLWNDVTQDLDSGVGHITNAITLADLLLAIIIIAVTVFVSRNIPGLLEMAVLQPLPFTPSGRYAITSITRYILVIVGVVMAFSVMGVGWSKVQWLVAAITVGLGFGLQEIFANFVSGLIILFERPIRVGDTVTVGNIHGKISHIQMRATMVIDWDRKELIIPNKEFVTGQVINWSLSDTILRITIPVGIAYGSDTELAHRLLLEIAADHPNVLKDPEPQAVFVSLGESSLDFELRINIPNVDVRVETRHDILMEIDRRFRQAGIEIAFPQRDIHIREINMPKDLAVFKNLNPVVS